MQIFRHQGIPEKGQKAKKNRGGEAEVPEPAPPGHAAAARSTWTRKLHLPFKGSFVYVATVIDYLTKEAVGAAISVHHDTTLVMDALFAAVHHRPHPNVFHSSDNGREYGSKAFIGALEELGIQISRSKKGSPWENGMQESFFDKFKIDLGDPNRFKTLGELAYEIHHTIWVYNHTRIHSVLKMPPFLFAERYTKF